MSSSPPRPFADIPRAPCLPLVGSIPHVLRQHFAFFERAHQTCGDLFVVDLGIDEIVLVGDPHITEQIFVHRVKNYDKGGGFWDQARASIGNGVAFAEGELWRRQRRLMNPGFRRAMIMGFHEIMDTTIDELLDELEREVEARETLDISAWTATLTGTLTMRLLFGGELDAEAFAALRNSLVDLTNSLLVRVITRSLPPWIPVPGAARARASAELIEELVLGIIAERRASPTAGNDLLNHLLNATDEQGAMSERQLLAELITLYVASYETTAGALAWTLMLLAEHPQLVRELQTELAANDDALDIPLIDAVFREGLRLFPSAPFLPRRAVNDDVLGGYRIPANTQVITMPWLIHRHPRYWPVPLRFDPRRHLVEHTRPRMAWIPFGAGQRTCIGMGMAMMEGSLALGGVLRRFTPLPTKRRSEPRVSGSLSSRDGVWVRLARR